MSYQYEAIPTDISYVEEPADKELAEAEAAYEAAVASFQMVTERRRKLCTRKCFFATSFLVLFIILTSLAVYFFIYDPIMSPLKEYDYIVVGSGPSGSIISRRLTDAGYDVLLLEAGGPSQYSLGGRDTFDGPLTRFDIPSFWSSLYLYEKYFWDG